MGQVKPSRDPRDRREFSETGSHFSACPLTARQSGRDGAAGVAVLSGPGYQLPRKH